MCSRIVLEIALNSCVDSLLHIL
uniref:Uncharacterized protein n=1 Tax=Anguilla anguilla TaxID=7936 RepID=A0A0E9RA75_ANGAN